jgi:hypothetical protein
MASITKRMLRINAEKRSSHRESVTVFSQAAADNIRFQRGVETALQTLNDRVLFSAAELDRRDASRKRRAHRRRTANMR